jgi:hypothetical protein
LGDFDVFKEVMLSYKNEKSLVRPSQSTLCHKFIHEIAGEIIHLLFCNSTCQDASNLLRLDVTPAHIYHEDQEDGEERPELDFSLNISPAGSKARQKVIPNPGK